MNTQDKEIMDSLKNITVALCTWQNLLEVISEREARLLAWFFVAIWDHKLREAMLKK